MQTLLIDEVVSQNIKGLYYGNRLILPFKADFLKIVIDDELIVDFSMDGEKVEISEEEYFTNIYFLDEEDLAEVVTKFETIKIVAVEKKQSLFDLKCHKMLALSLEEPHFVNIKYITEEMLFID